ncbi:hypothetical protein CY35_01G190000 [Sphagnum magellanicum]|nr:hypothetical protein CY35_01G190000 [Sphagnum magellanicum]
MHSPNRFAPSTLISGFGVGKQVLKDLGLCVTLYDIKAVEGGFVFPGDGAPRFTVDFRLVMFRPFVGEVLIAKLKTCDKSGLYLSLGSFFEDIHIPEHLLQQPSTFDEDEKLWVWNYNGAIPGGASKVPTNSNRAGEECKTICSHANYWGCKCGWSWACGMVVLDITPSVIATIW